MRNAISDILKDSAEKLRREFSSTDSEGNTPEAIHQVAFFCNSQGSPSQLECTVHLRH